MTAQRVYDEQPDPRYQWRKEGGWWVRDLPPGSSGLDNSPADVDAEPFWDDYDRPSVTGW